MADPRKQVPENVPGDFFVDVTCIDCDACRQIASKSSAKLQILRSFTRSL